MKIRKLLALTVVLAMVAAVMPGFGLTALAAIEKGQGIVASNGDAYAASSDDLITDGAFETAAWESALTTGAYVDSSGGSPGIKNVIKMNSDATMNSKGAVAFERVEGRNGGNAISPAFVDFTPDGAIHRYTNDENGPTSIKHYVLNDGGTKKTYYVSFWAKALKEGASLRYYIGTVGENDVIPSSTSVKLSDEWTQIDAVAEVKNGQYLIINVYDMGEDAVALDDFEACEVSQSADSRAFAQAIAQWPNVFKYTNGQIIREDMDLPTRVGSANVTWDSSDVSVIDLTGAIALVETDTPVTLTATISYRSLNRVMTYNFTVEGFVGRIKNAVATGGLVPKYANPKAAKIDLPASVPGFEGSKITWASSDESIIAPDGTYNAPEETGKVTLTASVDFAGSTIEQDVDIYVGSAIKYSLVPNGAFEVFDSSTNTVVDWTNGQLAPLTTTDFDYMTEENGNHYILSKTHGSWDAPGSVRMYVDLEPGKHYTLSFKMWYNGAERCQESYTAAVLVPDQNTNINDGGYSGGMYYPGGSYSGKLSKDDGWQTVNVGTLNPTDTYHTLLISAEWLNKTDGGLPDGRWAFDDFILEEIVSDFTADVTVNFLDEEGNQIKKPEVVKKQYGNLEYYATDANKADITVGSGRNKKTYRYMPDKSVDHVLVTENKENNVINLYFKEMVQSDVRIKFLERGTETELKKAAVDNKNGFIDFEYTVPNEYKASIDYKGQIYEYDATSDDTITVTGDKNNDIVTLYFVASDNLIPNGDFSNGVTGWSNRVSSDITGVNIAWDGEIGANAADFGTSGTGGKGATNSIGTSWNVETGKQYHFSFWLYCTKITENNYQYNKISDGIGSTDVGKDTGGNILYEYGKAYGEAGVGKWQHMELDFTAKTNILYFQSSYMEGFKLAKVELKEIDASKTGSVNIKYVDETGATIKEETVDNLIAGSTYTLTDEQKADFEKDGFIYRFKEASAESVQIEEGKTSEITLTFEKLSAADVTVSFKDAAGNTLKEDVTASGEVGKAFEVPAELKATINKDGKMYVYSASDPASLTVDADSAKNKITLIFVETSNLISNGDFEASLDGANIPNWTVGNGDALAGVAQMTTANFTVEEEDGNHYLKSMGGQGMGTAGSIKRFITLTPGKQYNFSFRVKRTAALEKQESWLQMELVKDDGVDIGENNTSDASLIEQYREKYGSIIPTNSDKKDMFLITPEDGWTTVSTIFTPDEEFKTLLIGAKWLDANWCFDDFSLVEMGDKKSASVKIFFVDEDGTDLKEPVVVENLTVGSTYTVTNEYKADITKDNITYRLNPGKSKLSVPVVEGVESVITLMFTPAPSTVTVKDNVVTVKANSAVNGVLVTAFFGDNGFIGATTAPVEAAAGESKDVTFEFAEGATDVKAFVLGSLENLAPMTNVATGKAPGAPLVSSIGQGAGSFHELEPQTGKVRYTFSFKDNGSKDSGIMLGNNSALNTTSGNYFASGSIVLLFANGSFNTRDANEKKEVAKYTAGEKVSVVIEADIASKTYSVSVNGEQVASNVGFRTDAAEINTLAICENGGGAAFEIYDFTVTPVE